MDAIPGTIATSLAEGRRRHVVRDVVQNKLHTVASHRRYDIATANRALHWRVRSIPFIHPFGSQHDPVALRVGDELAQVSAVMQLLPLGERFGLLRAQHPAWRGRQSCGEACASLAES